jgi:hypothetical protein
VPFVRFARDKRGYEQIWLVHAPLRRGRPGRARVLYWYRSPPGVRIGREPFDAAVRARLEAQYPDIRFDWEHLTAAALVPPMDVEPWRERRRAQREARRARPIPPGDQEAVSLSSEIDEPTVEDAAGPPPEPMSAAKGLAGAEATIVASADVAAGEGPAVGPQPSEGHGQRRRRGGRRRRRRHDGSAAPAEAAPDPDPTGRTTPSSDS